MGTSVLCVSPSALTLCQHNVLFLLRRVSPFKHKEKSLLSAFVLKNQRCAAGVSGLAWLRPFPAIGRSLSSHIVTPSQAQICLVFWKRPAERAMIPHASLQRREDHSIGVLVFIIFDWLLPWHYAKNKYKLSQKIPNLISTYTWFSPSFTQMWCTNDGMLSSVGLRIIGYTE